MAKILQSNKGHLGNFHGYTFLFLTELGSQHSPPGSLPATSHPLLLNPMLMGGLYPPAVQLSYQAALQDWARTVALGQQQAHSPVKGMLTLCIWFAIISTASRLNS